MNFTKRKLVAFSVAVVLCLSTIACTTDQVLADINVLIQIAASVGSAVGSVSPADAALIQKASGIASVGMAEIQSAYSAYKAAPTATTEQRVQAAVSQCRADLDKELGIAQITDPVSQQKVKNWANLIYSTLDAVLVALPQLQTKGKFGLPSAKVRVAMSITPSSLKSRWNTEVCSGDKACAGLVR